MSDAHASADPAAFEKAKQLFLEGLAHLEQNRIDDAERSFLASLEWMPTRASTLINLAAVQLLQKRPEAALQAADRALAVDRDASDAWFHRGRALSRLSRHLEALAAFEQMLRGDLPHAIGWLHHGQTLLTLGREAEAIVSYQRATALDASLEAAWSDLGGLLREAGRLGEAAEAYRQAIAHGADPALHGYYLASVTAQTVPTPPASYISTLFDDYAADFDRHLELLAYRGHTALVEQVLALRLGRFRSALDLGCGTGLCGPLLRDYADRLTGVDLSAQMIEKARALNCYDALVQSDIVEHLRRNAQALDLVVSADVFIYVGDLAPVFAAVAQRLTSGGLFSFTAEKASREEVDFELLPSLRYAQSERYLRALAETHGFDVLALKAETVREEQRVGIEALFVHLRKR
jgi:predicted TPR repeat methyltransferase